MNKRQKKKKQLQQTQKTQNGTNYKWLEDTIIKANTLAELDGIRQELFEIKAREREHLKELEELRKSLPDVQIANNRTSILKTMFLSMFKKREDVQGMFTVSAFIQLILSLFFLALEWLFYFIGFGALVVGCGIWPTVTLKLNILNIFEGICFIIFGRLFFRLARFEIENCRDIMELTGILSSLASTVAVVFSIFVYFISR